jgi:hypothetical protein
MTWSAFLSVLALLLSLGVGGVAEAQHTRPWCAAQLELYEGEGLSPAASETCLIELQAYLTSERHRLVLEGRPRNYVHKRKVGLGLAIGGGVVAVAVVGIGIGLLEDVDDDPRGDKILRTAASIGLTGIVVGVTGGLLLMVNGLRNTNRRQVRAVRRELNDTQNERKRIERERRSDAAQQFSLRPQLPTPGQQTWGLTLTTHF